MKFVLRDKEINELRRLRWLSEEQYSRTMVMTGVTGVGKTALIRHALSGYKVLFLFVSHKSEGLMLGDFKREIFLKLGLEISPSVKSLSDVFSLLLEASDREKFTVVIDQFHLLSYKVLSHLASLISEKKRKTNINLIFVSTDEIASNQLFQNEGSILFNCIDSVLSLRPFSHDEL
ncbi:MAG: ATP-binding protein, partial [Bacteroidales bacterium]|nr:ATP-binding protein [Bacteroidales bacterium]